MAAFSACRRGGESRLEGIADDLEHHPAVGFDGLAQGGVVDLQRLRHLLGLRSHSGVEPWMSVNRKVTVPVGRDGIFMGF